MPAFCCQTESFSIIIKALAKNVDECYKWTDDLQIPRFSFSMATGDDKYLECVETKIQIQYTGIEQVFW
jgi:hypothetical protein